MFNKINIKWLAGIFALLLLLVIWVSVRNKSNSTIGRNRTFTSQLTDFDTSGVTAITIFPKLGGEMMDLTKTGGKWKIDISGKKYNADEGAVKNMLHELKTLTAQRIAANNESKWAEFEATDSAATRVQLLSGKKIVADVYLGKFSYKPPKNQNPYMQQQQQGTMTSYVRPADESKVYAVEGLIAMTFNRRAADFRDRTIVRVNKESLNKLTFNQPDGNYSLTKEGNNWMIDGLVADSASVADYLSSIAYLSNSNFLDDPVLEETNPSLTLSIEGDNMTSPVKIKAFVADTATGHAISSSLNEGTWFSGKLAGTFDKIFVPKEKFFARMEAVE